MLQKDLLRYSCQIALPGFSETSQNQLQHARVLIVGMGGLGCPAAQYLAAAGVGILGLADFDVVSISNLHRQVLFTPGEVGLKKALVAGEKLQKQNRGINIVIHDLKVTSENVLELLEEYDLVLDGTDNFDTKYLLNDACVLAGKPLVYGAIYQFEGQVAVWNVENKDGSYTPHYRDVYPEVDASQVPNCAEGGVIPTLAGMIGCMQANETIKLITGTGDLLAGKMLLLDASTMQTRIIKVGAVSHTPVTGIQETEEIPSVSVRELKESLAKGQYTLIDVRSAAERAGYHMGGQHIPVEEIEKELPSLPSDKPFVLYCATGKRSREAVRQLLGRQPDLQVYSLEGGLKAWSEQA